MKRTFFALLFLTILFFSCSKEKEIQYTFIGEFDYEIINDSLLNQTHLKGGLGYTIGDLEIQGVEIKNTDTVKNKEQNQFIVSMNSPISKALKNSEDIDCNCYPKNYNPLEVIKDTSVIKEKMFIYRIDETEKYNIILP
ncbi:hypothetical protein [Moheibacter sediminis]|uniref:Lipoprotein n=1 Tax=Moheibacter sediminis TaxID=1434700 RepID=A0A1W1YAV1_9FLAO|nr:hypothetical protein [Moheibacter sediminis]SMC33269.1 hypothetical protein SAMN06296427_101197 [Moheibacter sediminis]